MSTRKVFAANINESVNSEIFIKFMKKLKDFIEVKNETSIDRYPAFWDNDVIHRYTKKENT